MKIVEGNFEFKAKLATREKTEYCVLHHAAWKKCSAADIHRIHTDERKWYGIGYHYFVGKDGIVTTGRSIETVGAHCEGNNYISVGICFEGDFEVEEMGEIQLQAGKELLKMISDIYPGVKFMGHGNMPGQNTLCPGIKFPFKKITNLGEKNETEKYKFDALNEAFANNIITDYNYWKNRLDEPTPVWAVMAMINNATRYNK